MSCRKKIDSKIWLDYVTMETEVKNLKKELNHTRNDLKISKKKCRELIKNLDNQKIYHQSEHNLRDKQLTKILGALLVLESRLRQEQKTIRQQLIEKDNTIRTQQIEISRLRRQTKNYIKINNRENNNINIINPGDLNNDKESDNCNYINDIGINGLNNNNLRNHINRLKRELVNKIGSYDNNVNNYEFGVKKTDSFAGSDVSKESIGSENTDASILTTTTEGSLSVLSTEGFCEGESTDVSPGSTLDKSSRYKNLNSETDMCIKILDCHNNNDDDDDDDGDDDDDDNDVDKYSKRRLGISRTEPMEIFNNQISKISRSDSKDDGMDCNFISEEEDDDDEEESKNAEPIYVNACSINNNSTKNIEDNDVKILKDQQFNSDNNENKNNNKNRSLQLQPQDKSIEETNANWYSDPDEDRISEEFSRHNTYRTNSKHNSVLESVNQILLRDMEDEENILSVSKKFKHRGRIVSFQPARLSDIESVGSEMERRNSEEANGDKESQNFESNNSEDDYIMINNNNNNNLSSTITSSECVDSESGIDEEIIDNNGLARAIPIVIIEPDINDIKLSLSPNSTIKTCNSTNNNSLIRLESIEEKTCLSMSTKNLTIAKNLDYEDIESLPDVTLKTPPALPPKPKFRTNTLILKKIPSPSFFIDENKDKNSPNRDTYIRNYYKTNKQINKTTGTTSARSLVFRKKSLNDIDNINYDVLNNNNNGNNNNSNNDLSLIPRVGNIVRHFEEFKIGSDTDIRINKTKDHKIIQKIDEIDIRQNFEEFNFDDCDLSDDPDRLDGDGSDKLVNNIDTSTSSTPSTPSSPTKTTTTTTKSDDVNSGGIYDHFLEATGLSTKSILTPSRLISNHRDMLKPKDIKYKNKIKSNTINDKNNCSTTSGSSSSQTHVKHWTGPFV